MSTILTGMIIISISGAFALLWKRKIEELLGFSVIFSVILLYISGILGHLSIGRFLIICFSIVAALYCLWCYIFRDRKNWITSLFTPGLLVFIILLLYIFLTFRNRLADSYDDFSHWALEIKNMYVFNAIPNGVKESTVYFTNYPPGSALFAYLWISLSSGLNEGDMFRSLMVFSLSMLFPIFSCISWRQWKLIVPLAIICYVLPLLFNADSYSTLLVDCLLGTVLAYPVYFYYVSENKKGAYLITCSSLFALTLIKVSGFGLSILLLLVLTIALLIRNREKHLPVILTPILPFYASCILAKLSWYYYLKITNPAILHSSNGFSVLLHLFTQGLKPYQISGIETYLAKMISPASWTVYSGQTFLFWLVVFFALTLIFSARKPCEHKMKNDRAILLSMGSCGIMYAISLLFTYFVYFSESEASTVTACERYLSTVLIAMFSTMLLVFFNRLVSSKTSGSRNVFLLMLVVLIAIDPVRLYVNTIGQSTFKNGAQISRLDKKPSDFILSTLDSQTDSVYFLTQEDNAYPYWVNRFDFTPIHLYDGQCIHLKTEERMIETSYDRFLTVNEWESELKKGGYTHLYIYNVTQEFIDDFGCLFENSYDIEARRLYFIENIGNSIRFKLDD